MTKDPRWENVPIDELEELVRYAQPFRYGKCAFCRTTEDVIWDAWSQELDPDGDKYIVEICSSCARRLGIEW